MKSISIQLSSVWRVQVERVGVISNFDFINLILIHLTWFNSLKSDDEDEEEDDEEEEEEEELTSWRRKSARSSPTPTRPTPVTPVASIMSQSPANLHALLAASAAFPGLLSPGKASQRIPKNP